MAKVSGHGGYWVLDGSPDVNIHNAEYELDLEGMVDDVTDSESAGWAQGLAVCKKVASLRMSVAEDSANYPEALGLVLNSTVTLWLKKGAAAAYDKVTNTIVRNIRKTNPQTGARRVEIVCEYGTYTENAAAPA